MDVELNLDPVEVAKGVALTALAGGVAFVAGVFAWHGLSLPGPTGPITFVKGLKETTLGKDAARAYEKWAIKRRIRASGGEVVDSRTGLTQEEIQDALLENIGDTECQLLNREFQKARRNGRPDDAARFLEQATEQGCPWVKRV